MRLTITDAAEEFDCRHLSNQARPEDRMEWEEALGIPLFRGLEQAIRLCPANNRVLLDERELPVAAWGVHPTDTPGVGQVWFIATTAATRHVHRIHSLWHSEIAAMHALFPLLVCYTHRDNHLHHTWLARRGFALDCEMQLGPRGATYYTYSRRLPCADQPSPS